MDQYSADTRVELTALGWLRVADERLKQLSKAGSKRVHAERKRRARAALSAAVREVEGRAAANSEPFLRANGHLVSVEPTGTACPQFTRIAEDRACSVPRT